METEFKKILVCLSNTDADKRLVESAGVLARAAGTEEVLFCRVELAGKIPEQVADRFKDLTPSPETVEDEMEETVAASFGEAEGIRRRYEARAGAPVHEILSLAASEDVDLIAVSQPDAAPGLAAELANLATRLARKSHCCLVSLPPFTDARMRRVLVPVRNSECSRRALQTAIDLAEALGDGAEVIAHYVYPVPAGYARVGLTFEEFSAALKDAAQDELEALMKKIEKRDVQLTTVFTEDPEDNPSATILKLIDERKVDSVVIGSRGRTGAAGIILGHVTETLIEKSPTPVLAVKKKGENIGLLKALGVLM